MVEVFKTNIHEETIAMSIQNELLTYFPEFVINFDLEDCDKILRIENCRIHVVEVIQILNHRGFECQLLE